MRALIRLIEFLVFFALVWGAIAALRLASGEPWPSIAHRPFIFYL